MTHYYNVLATSIHEDNVNVGWWDEWPNRADRFKTARVLVVSELIEGLEGWRKDLKDDHLPDIDMLHVEMADAMIRLFDLAGAMEVGLDGGFDLDFPAFDGVAEQIDHMVGELYNPRRSMEATIAHGIAMVDTFCYHNEIDIMPIVDLKRAYNAKRLDHKRETRAAPGGKKI